MFSQFLSLFKRTKHVRPTDFGPTIVDTVKMSLEERKTYRQEVIKQTLRNVMADFHIIGGMYRYRLMPVDDRAHYFAIMIETTKHFAMSKDISMATLSKIEESIKAKAFSDHGVVVDGVYWKANETIEVFENATYRDIKIPSTRPKRTISEIAKDFAVSESPIEDNADPLAMDDSRFNKIVDGKEYNTDITPLAPE